MKSATGSSRMTLTATTKGGEPEVRPWAGRLCYGFIRDHVRQTLPWEVHCLLRSPAMLSIIVPVLNEADSLRELFDQVTRGCAACGQEFELIFIDDGSTDTSWLVIQGLAAEHPQVGAIRFRRNFGKAAALSAGMKATRGDLILMMDADLQDDRRRFRPCYGSSMTGSM